MPDLARSDDPAVQAQLDRLSLLSPGRDTLGLERITALLARLGDPQLRLPPVFHVAGTNGKGSTCAALRAAIEAAGLRAHVYTSPHLVRFNERIRIAGRLIEDAPLAALLREVLDAAEGIGPSFFEATTAVAFLAFARAPADACILEVGLGGRLDATNVVPRPAACGIAQLGVDHQSFLGDTIGEIAAEKAGIAGRGAPLLTMAYVGDALSAVARVATEAGAIWLPRGGEWDAKVEADHIAYRDAKGSLRLPPPRLTGEHQGMNAALAVAMLRHQDAVPLPERALAAVSRAEWPARLQRLAAGPLTALLPDSEIWLDGGHNPAAAQAIADHFAREPGRSLDLVVGMLANKDAPGLLAPFAGIARRLVAVPVPGHEHHAPETLAALARSHGLDTSVAGDVPAALRQLRGDPPSRALILGSLYLAGDVLRLNGQLPD